MKRRINQYIQLFGLLIIINALAIMTGINSVAGEVQVEESLGSNALEDVTFNFEANSSIISPQSCSRVELYVANDGINPIVNVSVDFAIDGNHTIFTPTYAAHQEEATINPGYSNTFLIEALMNESFNADDFVGDAADVCLMFDGSGSMVDEAENVRESFGDLINTLSTNIPNLRMGMVVYGWNKYSEYPLRSSENYVELTSDFGEIDTFIQDFIPDGTIEPWGDALYLVNSWNWRANVPKLIIMVGDEDCDPGDVVGVGSTADYYNGSQLLTAVTNLKEKGIVINTVRSGYQGIVENQFNWIANYTEGEAVLLDDLMSGENPIDLSGQIEEWALDLVREYFINVTANISWTEVSGLENYDYSTVESLQLLLDATGPSLSITAIFEEQLDLSFDLELSVQTRDYAGVGSVLLFYTLDDITAPEEPTWYFSTMTATVPNKSYFKEITGLVSGSPISYYIIAIDGVGNTKITEIYNKTVMTTPFAYGSTVSFYLTGSNSSKSIYFDFSHLETSYLRIETEDDIAITFDQQEELTTEIVLTVSSETIYSIESAVNLTSLRVIVSGDVTIEPILMHWVAKETVNQLDLMPPNTYDVYLSPVEASKLVYVQCDEFLSGFISIIIDSPALVAKAKVYTADWMFVGEVSAVKAVEVSVGGYYLWVERVAQDGYLRLIYDDESYTTTDSYYNPSQGEVIASGWGTFVLIGISFLVLTGVVITRKRYRRRQ